MSKSPHHSHRRVPALGLGLTIGSLYNAHVDEPVHGGMLWNPQETQSRCETTDIRHVHKDLVLTKDSQKLYDKLGVDLNVRASFAAGLGNLGVTGKFASEAAKASNVQHCAMMYMYQYSNEKLTSTPDASAVNPFYRHSGATHVVVAVEWGAFAMVSFEVESKDSKEALEMQAGLEVAVKAVASGTLGFDKASAAAKALGQARFHSECLGLESITVLSKDMDEMIVQFNALGPAQHSGGGKGTVLYVHLQPLSAFVDTAANLYFHINDHTLTAIAKIVEDTRFIACEVRRLLGSGSTIGHKALGLMPSYGGIVEAVATAVDGYHGKLSAHLRALLPQLRSTVVGHERVSALGQLLDSLLGSGGSSGAFQRVYGALRQLLNTIAEDGRFADESVGVHSWSGQSLLSQLERYPVIAEAKAMQGFLSQHKAALVFGLVHQPCLPDAISETLKRGEWNGVKVVECNDLLMAAPTEAPACGSGNSGRLTVVYGDAGQCVALVEGVPIRTMVPTVTTADGGDVLMRDMASLGYSWQVDIAGPPLPGRLVLNSRTGSISGTPTEVCEPRDVRITVHCAGREVASTTVTFGFLEGEHAHTHFHLAQLMAAATELGGLLRANPDAKAFWADGGVSDVRNVLGVPPSIGRALGTYICVLRNGTVVNKQELKDGQRLHLPVLLAPVVRAAAEDGIEFVLRSEPFEGQQWFPDVVPVLWPEPQSAVAHLVSPEVARVGGRLESGRLYRLRWQCMEDAEAGIVSLPSPFSASVCVTVDVPALPVLEWLPESSLLIKAFVPDSRLEVSPPNPKQTVAFCGTTHVEIIIQGSTGGELGSFKCSVRDGKLTSDGRVVVEVELDGVPDGAATVSVRGWAGCVQGPVSAAAATCSEPSAGAVGVLVSPACLDVGTVESSAAISPPVVVVAAPAATNTGLGTAAPIATLGGGAVVESLAISPVKLGSHRGSYDGLAWLPDDPNRAGASAGIIFVSSAKDCVVVVVDAATGVEVCTLGSPGRGRGQFSHPQKLGVAPALSSGAITLLVAEDDNKRVQEVTTIGEHVRFFSTLFPVGGVSANSEVVVAGRWDDGSDSLGRLAVFSRLSGAVIARFGKLGSEPGQLQKCWGLGLTSTGLILTADYTGDRVCVWDPSGVFHHSVHCGKGSWPAEVVEFQSGVAIAATSSGLVTLDPRTPASGGPVQVQPFASTITGRPIALATAHGTLSPKLLVLCKKPWTVYCIDALAPK